MAHATRTARAGDARRAPRFRIVAPVRYRAEGEGWLDATTVDIGRLGVLMLTRHPASPPGTVLELLILLTPSGARGGADLACTGRVVRVEPGRAAAEAALAVTIDDFRLRRAGPMPPRERTKGAETGGRTPHRVGDLLRQARSRVRR